MYAKLLRDSRTFSAMRRMDQDLAEQVHEGPCPYCGKALHWRLYPRKPRGPRGIEITYDRRFSLCCGACRRSVTPPSVMFMGRKVYVGSWILLLAAMVHGLSAERVALLRRRFGISKRTLERWRTWWLAIFKKSPFWKRMRASFMPPVSESQLPRCLLARFGGSCRRRMERVLVFLRPITTTSCAAALSS